MLADEPTGELDFRTGAQILDLLVEQASGDRAVLVVTHNREISRIADRVVEMSSGNIISDGPPEGGKTPLSKLRLVRAASPQLRRGGPTCPPAGLAYPLSLDGRGLG